MSSRSGPTKTEKALRDARRQGNGGKREKKNRDVLSLHRGNQSLSKITRVQNSKEDFGKTPEGEGLAVRLEMKAAHGGKQSEFSCLEEEKQERGGCPPGWAAIDGTQASSPELQKTGGGEEK